METKSGWRATPAPLLLAFGTWLVFSVVRIVLMNTMTIERGFSQRMQLTGEGISFACMLLVLVGTLELMNRMSGDTRSKIKLALVGISLVFIADTISGFVMFTKNPWDHQWFFKAYEYAAVTGWLVFAVGLALALPAAQRAFGFAVIGVTFLTWMPPPLHDKVMGVIGLEGKSLFTLEMVLRFARLAMLALLCMKVSHGETASQPASAAEGLRTAAAGLWLRVVLATAMALFMMLMLMSRGAGQGALSFFKLLSMGQVLFSVIALLMTGLGALRAARCGVKDLDPYILAVAGGLSLWGAGVSLAQMPQLYRALYGDGDGFSGRDLREATEALSTALPIIVIVGVGLLATALAGFAARRGNDQLRSDAQGKGIGYVVLTLVGIAMATWMLPTVRSQGSLVMIMVLTAIASLWATAMMAKLLGRGADVIASEPGLPPATVVSDPPA